jgi:hypothetical protein
MAYTTDDLAALQRAIARGARVLEMAGERVEFRSLKEMERIEAKIKEELGQATGRRVFNPSTGSGWR